MRLDKPQMRCDNKIMKKHKDIGLPVRISIALKTQLEEIALKERRTFKDQMAILLEAGVAEYERQQKLIQDVAAGKTQIDMEQLKRGVK
jgi:hypothetical protein